MAPLDVENCGSLCGDLYTMPVRKVADITVLRVSENQGINVSQALPTPWTSAYLNKHKMNVAEYAKEETLASASENARAS